MTRASKFANGTLLLALAATVLLFVYFGLRQWQGTVTSPYIYSALTALLLLFAAALRLPLAIKLNLALLLISGVMTLYALEAFLLYNGNPLGLSHAQLYRCAQSGVAFRQADATASGDGTAAG